MHPNLQYELMQAQLADMRHRAELRTLALAARQARRQRRQQHGASRRSYLARRLFRGWQPSRDTAC